MHISKSAANLSLPVATITEFRTIDDYFVCMAANTECILKKLYMEDSKTMMNSQLCFLLYIIRASRNDLF